MQRGQLGCNPVGLTLSMSRYHYHLDFSQLMEVLMYFVVKKTS